MSFRFKLFIGRKIVKQKEKLKAQFIRIIFAYDGEKQNK
jgi:hypothetical protein